MSRTLIFAWAAVATLSATSAQDLPVLRITATVLDGSGQVAPVIRHQLLVSDVPVSGAPRVVTTSPEGTAEIRLRPGRYIIESDRPFVANGRAYEWRQTFEIVANRDTALALSAANAAVEPAVVPAAGATSETPGAVAFRPQPASILTTWQDSAVGVWTAHAHAAAFLVDERGLFVTSRRAIGDADTLAVQISGSVKVAGVVATTDATREVAVVRVHPSRIQDIRPVPIDCDAPALETDRFVIDVPLFGPKDINGSLVATPGGPVFGDDGRVVGLLSEIDHGSATVRNDVVVVPAGRVCEALTSARATFEAGAPPAATHLPVEPVGRVSPATIRTAAAGRPFDLSPYQFSSSDFDVTFITPVLLASAESRRGWSGVREDELSGLRVATDFEAWDDYVREAPPVVFVRATPRLVEGFWLKLARGAASLQGAQLPPIKRLRPGFSRMRLMCGALEVTPIHPFRIQARVTETDAIEEGFYVFDPATLGPECGRVSVLLSSVKDPERIETRVVDPAIVRRVQEDFARLR